MVASNDSHKYASHSGERYLHLHHHYAAASSSDDLHATSSSLLCRSMIIRTAVCGGHWLKYRELCRGERERERE